MAVPGTAGYAEQAEALVAQYEALDFAAVHREVLPLIPALPCDVLEVGAGTGRDAAALAAMGHRVLAVEPTAALRERARALHPSGRIAWLDDALPALARVRAPGQGFGLVMLTAVWMHLDAAERRAGMPRLAGLMAPGAVLVLSLRHGPVPPGRRMFDVTAEETVALAEAAGLGLLLRLDRRPAASGRAEVSWTRLGFRRGAAAGATG